MSDNLNRFISAQQHTFNKAYTEIQNGRKVSHWMWFIFPQISGFGFSDISKQYAIKDLEEAELYLQDPILGDRLIRISEALLTIKDKTAYDIFGSPDDLKLKSSMTLFSLVKNTNAVFEQVLNMYFNGEKDLRTYELLKT